MQFLFSFQNKRINKNVSNDELSFTDTLDPGQTTLLNIFTVFWGLYIGNIGSTINSDSEFATRMKKDISKIRYPEFPSLEGSNIGKLSQTQYLSSVIRVHIKMVQSLFGQIPEFKAMSEGARRTLTRIGCCQMAMLRGSYRYQMLKFEAEQRRRCNEEMGEYSPDEGTDSTEHLSMSEHTLGMDKLKSIGLSEGLLKKIKNLSLNGGSLRNPKVESYDEPDFVEWSILSGLCLLNNEAMFAENVLPIERSTVERLQESLLIILRMKIQKDGKPLYLLARYIAFLSELRAYSDESIKEWGKYFHYQPKICLASTTTPQTTTQSVPTATV